MTPAAIQRLHQVPALQGIDRPGPSVSNDGAPHFTPFQPQWLAPAGFNELTQAARQNSDLQPPFAFPGYVEPRQNLLLHQRHHSFPAQVQITHGRVQITQRTRSSLAPTPRTAQPQAPRHFRRQPMHQGHDPASYPIPIHPLPHSIRLTRHFFLILFFIENFHKSCHCSLC